MLYAFPVLLNPYSVDITEPCLFLRSYSVHSSSKLLNCFPCRSGERTQSQMAQDPVNTGHVVSYRISSYLPLQFLLEEYLVSSVYLTVLYTCCLLNMSFDVSTGIIFADMQNLMALRMSFDGVTSIIFRISYHDRCAISDILII